MKRFILSLLLAALLPTFCYAQYEKKPGRLVMFNVTSVYPNWGGGPCVIRFSSFEGEMVTFSLVITSTFNFEDSIMIDIGKNVQESLDWLEKMEVLCTATVGSRFAITENGSVINDSFLVMVGDRSFSGIGDMDEKGYSLVFSPEGGERRYGVYGVQKSTFKKLRKKLAKVAKEKGLK